MSWIPARDYSSVGPATQDDLDGVLSTLGTHTSQIATLNGQQAVQDANIATETTRNDTQDARLDNIETGYSVHFTNLVARVDGHDVDIAAGVTKDGEQDATLADHEGRLTAAEGEIFGSLYDLSTRLDVSNPLTNGYVLTFNAGTGKYKGAPSGGTLAALGDVQVAAPAARQSLVHNGTKWANRQLVLGDDLGADLSDVLVNHLTIADQQVLTWNAGGSKWTNGAVPRSIRDLSDVSTTPPTNGQILLYSTALGKYQPVSLTTSSSIVTATDYLVNGTLAAGDALVWDGTASKWRNNTSLTTHGTSIATLQTQMAQVGAISGTNASLNNSVTSSYRYSNTSLTTGPANNVAISDVLYPWAYRDNSVAFDVPWTNLSAVSLMQGAYYGQGGVLAWKGSGGTGFGVNPGTGTQQFRMNISFSAPVTLDATFSLLLSVGFAIYSPTRYQWWGSNSPGFMTESSYLAPTGTLLFDSGTIATWTGVRQDTPLSVGPWQYLAFVVLGIGTVNNFNANYVGVRSAPGGLTGKSVATGELAVTRDTNATGAVIVAKTTASTNSAGESIRWDLGRLGLWELYNRLLPTVSDIGVLRVGGWRLQAGADLRELSFVNDGWQISTNTTPTTVAKQGFSVRTSLQGGKNYLIIRPAGTAGLCVALNMDATANGDNAFILFKNTTGSGVAGDVVAVVRQGGDLFLGGAVTQSQAGLMGTLNPYT